MTVNSSADTRDVKSSRFFHIIGPGILYAAAAVGVSHLVQSTRAGALYGFEMTCVILIACLLKYPGLRFGGEYAAATGKSLVYGYARIGRWALILYVMSQIFSIAFVVAAVALVAAGLIEALLKVQIDNLFMVVGLLMCSAILLISGRYHYLEKVTKFIVALLTVLLLLSIVLVIQKQDFVASGFILSKFDMPTLMFVIALMGFMPTPMDASVMQSLWTCQKSMETGKRASLTEVRLDFNIGFFISILLALCFMVLGAGVMFGSGEIFEKSAGGFAAQLIGLFTVIIGDWSFYVIGIAAVAAMLSTLITILDGYPRAAEAVMIEILPNASGRFLGVRFYDIAIIVFCLAAVIMIGLFMQAFSVFIDLTAAIIFFTSPVLAFLNHKAMFSNIVAEEMRPNKVMQYWSVVGVIMMAFIAMVYFFIRLTS